MDFEAINYRKDGVVGIIQLDRPERMNAVNEAMYREIQSVLNHSESDNDIRVLIITGSVLKKDGVEKQAFCAGADLKEHAAGKRDKVQKREYIELAHATTRMIYEFPKPVIAAINGPARGAGVEMALNCDFIVMAENATIAFTETSLGTFVGGGVTDILPSTVGIMKAKQLIYSGKVIDGKDAVNLGIVLETVPVDEVVSFSMAFANDLAEKAPLSIKLAKSRLQNSKLIDIEQVLKLETEAILSCMETDDWYEGIQAYMEKRKPVYKGK